ncbi:unnamed protein product [Rotaria magnacalcarata]|uniref:Uncharacterized protein n=1 Tax=Rotaria magnacalcarata TaxID=392030 RepID=A0A816TR38_9BILA|nr:unnamed protein product [Rotaria magnacalcarata]
MSKDQHPYLTANPFSKIFHSWISSLLSLRRKRPLEYRDLFDILPDDQSEPWIDRLEKAWEHEIVLSTKSSKKKQKPSLIRATWSIYRYRYGIIGIFLFVYTMLRFIQPFILARFIRCLVPCSKISLSEMICWAALNSVFPWLMFTIRHLGLTRAFLAGMHIRCAYHGLIFRKMIRLSMGSLGAQTSGKIINIMTNDVQTVDHLGLDAHFLWIGTLETIVVLVILWSHVGFTILLAMIYTLMVISVQILCGKVMQIIWTKRVQQTDLRIKLMNEIVKSIHLVKMYVWERPFQLKVERVRRKETFYVILKSLMNSVKIVNGYSFSLIFFLIVFGLLWYRRATFNTDFFTIAFVLISYLRHTYLHGFATSCVNLSQYWVAVQRIQEFLSAGEFNQQKMVAIENEFDSENKLTIDIQNLSSIWESSSFQLRDVTFSARTGELIIVIGSIASGKSSLLMTLLGEMKMIDGTVKLNRNARFCYVPQESWIFSDSIKENILFGMEFNEKKFNESIYAAGFDTDIANFQYGDSTLVGDNGVILSGGQKARLSLARALYRDEDIYLLDDPLSAVDVEVARHIFEKCILGRLRSKVCILVTHQIQFLKYATTILFFDKVIKNTILFYGMKIFLFHSHNQENQLASGTYSQLHQMCPEFKQWTQANTNNPRLDSSSASYTTGQLNSSPVPEFVTQLIGRWSNAERIRYASKSTNVNCTIENHLPIRNMTMNAWFKKRDNYFYTLLGFVLLNIILLFLRTLLYFLSTHIAARTIHSQMFSSTLRAPIYFFDTNPIGRIINRCSKDISPIDEKLSETTYNFIEAFSNIASTISFIAYIQPVSLISLIFVGAILERIRRFFSPAIRDIKRLESLGRSPIYSHICATIQGIPLIRSYGAQTMCTRNFSYYLDEHSRAFSLMLTMNRWLAMRIESVVATFIGLLTFSMFLVHRNLPVSDLGLILAYSFTLMGSVQWIVRLTVDVMMQMTSTERVIEYIDLKPEESSTSDQLVILPPRWPIGSIVFDNMSFRYSDDSSWVLSNINISIEPGEKIGIVGRTGAGKSSVIQALFRMAELDGRILIDEIDTKQIPLYELRRHISIIPQDPVLINDSLRINLDPFGEYSDIEIWSALNEVQFKFDLIEGLQHNVTEGGSNFSVGQRQLICLARALLRKNRILLIDEATANVDHKTDEIIQVAIRRKFIHCTVLTIAHRLRTIIDSDKILVRKAQEII